MQPRTTDNVPYKEAIVKDFDCGSYAPNTLESVQKFAFKMATHNWNASYLELQSLINIPTLERRRLELKLCHLFKIVHNLCYFPQDIIRVGEWTASVSQTRFVHQFCLQQPYAHTNSYFYSFVPHAISYWNSLPQELVATSSLKAFKFKLCDHNF